MNWKTLECRHLPNALHRHLTVPSFSTRCLLALHLTTLTVKTTVLNLQNVTYHIHENEDSKLDIIFKGRMIQPKLDRIDPVKSWPF